MEGSRLPAHLEVSGLVRAVNLAGGFATVLQKGERDAGTLLVVCCGRGQSGHWQDESGRDESGLGPGERQGARALERMPRADGSREWTVSRIEDPDDSQQFWDYIERRQRQDSDLWVVELDIDNAERFVVESGTLR